MENNLTKLQCVQPLDWEGSAGQVIYIQCTSTRVNVLTFYGDGKVGTES